MVQLSISEAVCFIMETAIAAGAQTERRGEAGPVWVLLGGGHTPATLFLPFVASDVREPSENLPPSGADALPLVRDSSSVVVGRNDFATGAGD
jgi:hypothetical protein